MSHAVVRSIIQDVIANRFFAIIADESTDIAGKQQLSFILQHVTQNFEIREDFIGLYEIDKADSDHLCSVIVDCLTRLNLNIHKARGQGYDGAAVMSGIRNGVAAKIAAIEPRAIYIHCASHSINLALQDTVQHVNIVRDALDLTREVVNFIRSSPKRSHLFNEIKSLVPSTETSSHSELSLRPLCPTKWTERTSSLSSVAVNCSRLIQLLTDISMVCKDDAGAKSSGFLRRLQSFEMFFGINLALKVFVPAEECCKVLQAKNLTAADARKSAVMTARLLQGLRLNERFDMFFDKCVADAKKLGLDEPRLGRKVKPPKRYDTGSEGYNPDTAKEKSRQIYNECIDTAAACILERFDNTSYELFSKIESVLVHCACSCNPPPEKDIQALCNHFGDDLLKDKLERQLSLLHDVCDGKPVIHVDEIVRKLLAMGQCSMLFSEVLTQLQLHHVIPATVATAERSFSAMRRMKSYLRSTMTSERVNSAMTLHVNKELANDLNILDVMREFVVRCDIRKDTFGLVSMKTWIFDVVVEITLSLKRCYFSGLPFEFLYIRNCSI